MAAGADCVVSLLSRLADRIRRDRRLKTILFLSPGLITLAIFFFLPFVVSLLLSFDMLVRERVGNTFVWILSLQPSLEYYIKFFTSPGTSVSIIQSLYYASFTTIGTLLISFPMAYYMAFKLDRRRKNFVLFLIFLPFWVNFIIRVYAIRFLFHPDGIVSTTLMALGITDGPISIIGTDTAVLITMVYSYLIFMLLPIYGVVEKINKELIEAAYTLGATPFKTLVKVTLPLAKPGIIAGSLLVFIPAMGEFIIPIIVGGGKSYPIGRLIFDQFIKVSGIQGWALGSAAAMVYVGLIVIATYLYFRFVGREVTLI